MRKLCARVTRHCTNMRTGLVLSLLLCAPWLSLAAVAQPVREDLVLQSLRDISRVSRAFNDKLVEFNAMLRRHLQCVEFNMQCPDPERFVADWARTRGRRGGPDLFMRITKHPHASDDALLYSPKITTQLLASLMAAAFEWNARAHRYVFELFGVLHEDGWACVDAIVDRAPLPPHCESEGARDRAVWQTVI